MVLTTHTSDTREVSSLMTASSVVLAWVVCTTTPTRRPSSRPSSCSTPRDCLRPGCVAENRFDLGVPRLAHDEHLIAQLLEPLAAVVDAFDVGAGRVDHVKAEIARGLLHLRNDAMGAQHERGACLCGHIVHHGDALARQALDHLGVMDERAQRVDGACGLLGHLLYKLERTLDAIAGARRGRPR